MKPSSLERKAVICCRFERSRSASVDCIIFVNVRSFEGQSTASTARIGPTSSFFTENRTASSHQIVRERSNGDCRRLDAIRGHGGASERTAARSRDVPSSECGWNRPRARAFNGRPRGHVTSHHLSVVGTTPAPGPSLALEARPISPLGLFRGHLAAPEPSFVRCAVPQPSNVARAALELTDVGRSAPQPSDAGLAAPQPCSVCGAHAYGPCI